MKFFLAVFGCQMNTNDADRIRTVLQSIGGTESENPEKADLIIYVTCSIRQHAEDRIYGLLRKYKPHGGIQAITGCMVKETSSQNSEKRDPLLKRSKLIDMVFRIEDAPALPKILKEFFPIPEEFSGEFPGIFETLPTQKQSHSAFVPISTGCDHHCTYCIVPHTRGKEVCRPQDEIIAECEEMIRRGAKEITLIGQNVNRYYFGERSKNPYKTDFAELLERVAKLNGLTWLRFLSPHPQHLGEDVLDVMAQNQTICKHLHLPVQSGDNEMLKKMARGYTVEKFKNTLELARKKIPGISITTDMIVGFCGETEEMFLNSAKLCEQEEFDQIFIGKFSVRPNTPAAKWEDDVPNEEKKRRFHVINNILRKTSKKNNLAEVGKTKEVLIDKVLEEKGAYKAIGRTNENRTVELQVGKRGKNFVGEMIPVKITGAKMFFFGGAVLFQNQWVISYV
jgi:tRNA-2-methylthio-N6-dimethylallyladenosine synthase